MPSQVAFGQDQEVEDAGVSVLVAEDAHVVAVDHAVEMSRQRSQVAGDLGVEKHCVLVLLLLAASPAHVLSFAAAVEFVDPFGGPLAWCQAFGAISVLIFGVQAGLS